MKIKMSIVFGVVWGLMSFGQSIGELVPPSPNAALLGQYADIPVSNYTGVPNITVPLYTIESGEITLPITLSYHASGIKVAQEASWVGLGWALNAGGVITRTVKDQPDESQNVSKRLLYGQTELDALNLDPYSEDHIGFLRAVATQSATYVDTQVDIFSFNFSGYSGSFYLDENLEAKLTNYENELKIRFLENLPINPTYATPTIIITDPFINV